MADLLDMNVDEIRAATELQRRVQSEYMGRTNNLKTAFDVRDRLRDGMAEIGFEVEINNPTGVGNYIPVVTIVGRTDKRLQAIMNEEGIDVERKSWDATRNSSKDLEAQGLNVGLL